MSAAKSVSEFCGYVFTLRILWWLRCMVALPNFLAVTVCLSTLITPAHLSLSSVQRARSSATSTYPSSDRVTSAKTHRFQSQTCYSIFCLKFMWMIEFPFVVVVVVTCYLFTYCLPVCFYYRPSISPEKSLIDWLILAKLIIIYEHAWATRGVSCAKGNFMFLLGSPISLMQKETSVKTFQNFCSTHPWILNIYLTDIFQLCASRIGKSLERYLLNTLSKLNMVARLLA